MADWDEYVDNQSGRRFYYNTITKEKSWKPPRKSKGSISEGRNIKNLIIRIYFKLPNPWF